MDCIEVGKVYKTNDLSIFKTLEGNRSVEDARVKKIYNSMVKNGYVHSPIIVNENMEVIDGQGRLQALRALGLPVEYVVFKGMTVKDCIVLNVYNTSWTLMDYVESYASQGNRNYQFLLHLAKRHSEFPIGVCLCAVTGNNGNGGQSSSDIKDGSFECTGEQYEKADELLTYAKRFLKTIKNFRKGNTSYIANAIMFAYQLECVDKEKLVKKFELYYGMEDIPQFVDVAGALKILTIIYNRRNQKDKIYFEVEYDKYLSGKLRWYTARWGKTRP